MPKIVLRFKLIYRLMLGICFVGSLALIGWLFWYMLPLTFNNPLEVLLLPTWLMFFLMILAVGYTAFFYWKYRLEFDETHVRLRTLVYLGIRPFTCAYNDVVRVQRGPLRGTLVIVPRKGKPLHLTLRSFDGERDQVLNILAQRVSPDVIEEDLPASLWQSTRSDRLQGGTVLLLLLFLAIRLSVDIGLDIVRGGIAWKTAKRWPLFTHAQVFGVDEEGETIWALISEGFDGPYQVQHLTPAGVEHWDLPDSSDGMSYRFPPGLGNDINGYPFLIYDEQILHWIGTEWKTQEVVGGEIMGWWRGLIISGDQLWVLVVSAENEIALVQMNMTTEEQQRTLLPEPVIQAEQKLRGIRQSVEGTLILWAEDGTRSQFYVRRNGQWSELAYLEPEPKTQVVDFALSPFGVLYALLTSNDLVYTVASWNVVDAAWTQYTLLALKDAPDISYDDRIEVDIHGRIWLSGHYDTKNHLYTGMITAFEPGADHELREVVQYTEYNSNYQPGHFSLYYAPDGRLWNLDERLVWIDTQMPVLPRPLPTWLAELDGIQWTIGFIIGYLIALVIFFINNARITKHWSTIEKSSGSR